MRRATAETDTERGYIERCAMLRLLKATRRFGINVAAISTTDGLRYVDLPSGSYTVRMSYPIWLTPDGEPASYQIDVLTLTGDEIATLLTGVDVASSQDDLHTLLRSVSDPNVLTASLGLIDAGEDPHLVFTSPFA